MQVADRLAMPGHDDIALMNAGKCAGTLGVHTHDHRARFPAALHGHRLKADRVIVGSAGRQR